MPNWVYNHVQVNGEPQQLEEFAKFIAIKPEYWSGGDLEWEPLKYLSFHSFVTLDPEHRDEYFETNGSSMVDGERVITGQGQFNWYQWNNNNWDTKWDACDEDVEVDYTEDYRLQSLTLRFNTAWSAPEPVFQAMCEKFPALTIDFEYEEEQGWGGEGKNDNGEYVQTKTWDIPNSHQDYLDRGNEESCSCYHYDDKADWYDDCPGKTPKAVYKVEVVMTFTVKADSEELAQTAVNADLSGYDPVDNTELVTKQYEPEYRVTELEEETV